MILRRGKVFALIFGCGSIDIVRLLVAHFTHANHFRSGNTRVKYVAFVAYQHTKSK